MHNRKGHTDFEDPAMLTILVLFQELCVDYCADELRSLISSPPSALKVSKEVENLHCVRKQVTQHFWPWICSN